MLITIFTIISNKYYLENKSKLPSLSMNMEAKFILDSHNELVWIDEAGMKKSAEVLGLVQAYNIPSGYGESITVQIFSEKAEFLTFELAEKIIIDGTKYTNDSLAEMLDKSPKYLIGKFCLYSLNSEEKINRLDTENYDAAK